MKLYGKTLVLCKEVGHQKNSEEPAEMPFANELGEDGWEMFQVVQYALNSCYYFRKVI